MAMGAHSKRNPHRTRRRVVAAMTVFTLVWGMASVPMLRKGMAMTARAVAQSTLRYALRQAPPTAPEWILDTLGEAPGLGNLRAVLSIEDECFETEFLEAPSIPQTTPTVPDAVQTVNLSINSGSYTVVENVALKNSAKKAVDVATLVREGFTKPTFEKEQPAVLIYHTHTTEAYTDGTTTDAYSTDFSKGVVAVGKAMAEVFESRGYKTIHITENFIDGKFSGAYGRSGAAAAEVLEKYPSIQLVLDVHRDSIAGDGVQYRPAATINGETYAQVMAICGTDTNGLEHPHWKKNLRFALAVAQTMQQKYPALSRPVNLRADRFNTHLTPYTLLLEMGAATNTLEEAVRSGRAVANCLADTMQS